MSLTSLEVLQERYEIVRRIKSGGMGSVYEAIDRKLANTPCAIKEVLASALQGPDAQYVLQSFDSEVRSLATLDCPNIPRVRDYFEIDQRRYIVMDLVQGKPLDEELQEHVRVTGEPMDPPVVALDMVTVLETLHYLHGQQPPIVHRDIKPANLIREQRTGRIKLVDFGIARPLESLSLQTQVGTPGFCAPEQMAGRAEARSDLYSVGATLFHLCTGTPPRAYSFDPMVPNLPTHPGLVAIVKKATAFKPEDRYANADEMAQALRRWLRNERSTKISPDQLPTQPKGSANLTTPLPPNHDRMLYAVVGFLLFLLVGFFGWVVTQDSSRPSQQAIVAFSPTATSSPTVATVTPIRTATVPPNRPAQVATARPPKARLKTIVRRPNPPSAAPLKPSLGSQDYPTGNPSHRSPPPPSLPQSNPPQEPYAQSNNNDDVAGFHLSRPVMYGSGGEYVRNIQGSEVKITAHELPNRSKDDILANEGRHFASRGQPFKRSGLDGGWCLYEASPGSHRGYHISDNVMFDIQASEYTGPISYEVDRFIMAYPKKR